MNKKNNILRKLKRKHVSFTLIELLVLCAMQIM